MSNYEYQSYSSSSSGGAAGGAGGAGGAAGFDVTRAIFNQADTNQDGTIDRNEFSQWAGGVGGGAVGGAAGQYEYSSTGGVGGAAGQYEYSSTGGAGGNFEASSYDSSSFQTGGDGAYLNASSFEASGAGLAGAGLAGAGGESSFQSASFESSSAGVGFDATALSQAAGYTAETNAAWSRYGAEVTGAGLYVDANPQIIRRQATGVQTYTQNIKIRFLQPPPIPPPGVSIIHIYIFNSIDDHCVFIATHH